ncbi:hypothetical protein QTI17_23785 [Variovorax sp. J31P179]|jgi:hypothetical protein|nr:hypothetical protein [Variovorax sp. J31P179]MDM0083624.1 hypothetical protein [Variovorax sp. J31P179]
MQKGESGRPAIGAGAGVGAGKKSCAILGDEGERIVNVNARDPAMGAV